MVEKCIFIWKRLVQVRSPEASTAAHGKHLQGLEAPEENLVPIFEPWALLPHGAGCGCPSLVLCSSKCLLHTEARVSLWNFIQTSLLCSQLSTGLPSPQGFPPSLRMGHLLASLLFFKGNSHFPASVCLCCPLCLQGSSPMYSMQLAPGGEGGAHKGPASSCYL